MFDKLKINKKYLNIGLITLMIGVLLLFVYQVSRHSVDIFLFFKNLLFLIFYIVPYYLSNITLKNYGIDGQRLAYHLRPIA